MFIFVGLLGFFILDQMASQQADVNHTGMEYDVEINENNEADSGESTLKETEEA